MISSRKKAGIFLIFAMFLITAFSGAFSAKVSAAVSGINISEMNSDAVELGELFGGEYTLDYQYISVGAAYHATDEVIFEPDADAFDAGKPHVAYLLWGQGPSGWEICSYLYSESALVADGTDNSYFYVEKGKYSSYRVDAGVAKMNLDRTKMTDFVVMDSSGFSFDSKTPTYTESPFYFYVTASSRYSMNIGESQKLNHRAYTYSVDEKKYVDLGRSEYSLTWESSNEDVATVDYNGEVKAVSTGSATITAYATRLSDGSTESDYVYIYVYDGLIYFDDYTTSMYPGEKRTFKVQAIKPSDADPADSGEITWSSSDTSVATVDENGLVTALTRGTTTITAEAYGISDYVTLRVGYVSISDYARDMISGDTLRIAFSTGSYNFAEAENLTCTSSDTSVVAIDGPTKVSSSSWAFEDDSINHYIMELKALKPGVSTITVEAYGETHSFEVTVSDEWTIKVNPDYLTLNVGESYKVSANVASVAYGKITNAIIEWSSNDPTIAKVDENGVVTAVSPGHTFIYGRTSDGTVTIRDSVFVTVRSYEKGDYDYNAAIELDVYCEDITRLSNIIGSLNVEYCSISEGAPFTVNGTDIVTNNATGSGVIFMEISQNVNAYNSDSFVSTAYTRRGYLCVFVNVKEKASSSSSGGIEVYPFNTEPEEVYPTYIVPDSNNSNTDSGNKSLTYDNVGSTGFQIVAADTSLDQFEHSVELVISQDGVAANLFSSRMPDVADGKNYVYYAADISLYDTDTNAKITTTSDSINIYLSIPEEFKPYKDQIRMFHINHDKELEELKTKVVRKLGKETVYIEMDEFSPINMYIDDLPDSVLEEFSSNSGYVTSKDEVVFVEYIDSGMGLAAENEICVDEKTMYVFAVPAFIFLAYLVFDICRRKSKTTD